MTLQISAGQPHLIFNSSSIYQSRAAGDGERAWLAGVLTNDVRRVGSEVGHICEVNLNKVWRTFHCIHQSPATWNGEGMWLNCELANYMQSTVMGEELICLVNLNDVVLHFSFNIDYSNTAWMGWRCGCLVGEAVAGERRMWQVTLNEILWTSVARESFLILLLGAAFLCCVAVPHSSRGTIFRGEFIFLSFQSFRYELSPLILFLF